MLAIHWTPVKNTKHILKNGITKSKNGVYCFPLTGNHHLDRWWTYFFNQLRTRNRLKYNGILFRINDQDLPVYFGTWIGATNRNDFKKEIKTVKELGKIFRETILWRMGEEISKKLDLRTDEQQFVNLAEKIIQKNPKKFNDKLNSTDFMKYTLEDYQIVLSNSIPAKRIIKIIPQGNEFGKIIRKKKLRNNIL
ncbi:MAG: hypothetical protein K8S23_15025 [Candidatus Cloacimonetes bacterium]|nr:hypothetical protein [Candidatus Cloacimonadota bacterium]